MEVPLCVSVNFALGEKGPGDIELIWVNDEKMNKSEARGQLIN